MTHDGSAPRPRVPLPRTSAEDRTADQLVAVLEGARGRMSRLLALLGDAHAGARTP